MNGKEIVFLAFLATATSIAGYTWSQKPEASTSAVATSKTNVKEPLVKPVTPNMPSANVKPNPAAQEQVGARHILVQYQGSERAAPTVTRTKDEAKALAEKVLAEVKAPGADFAALVGKYSDEPNAGQRGGDLGMFTRPRMVKEFSDAAFLLKPNEISGVVETKFGFHIIQRTK
jgi:parvulin-like peptidyl-prolyl isomerase